MNNVNAGCGKCKWFVDAAPPWDVTQFQVRCEHPKCYGKKFDWRFGFLDTKLWEPQDKNAEGDCEYFEPIENGGLK